jgi:hypothetical protein
VKRAWDEWVANLFDVISPQLVLLILLGGAGLAGALWYFFPAWVPRRLPRWRLRRPHWRRPRWKLTRRERKPKPPKPAKTRAVSEEPVPVPGAALSVADRLAAQGRYAEAIRERLRETVGALSAAGVVAPEPGETAAEVAATAAHRRPAVAAPLGNATELFSEVWYGDRPAGQDQDEHMRTLSGEVRARLRDGDPR